MRILGFQKTTLLDYPHKLAATIFLGGCNFRCPFCHNALLVTSPNQVPELSASEVLQYLKKRTGILEGVCITGGEPTLSAQLPEFIHSIKALGYHIKLDTNGSNPAMISSLLEEKVIDYIAMDIKNSPRNYAKTTGCTADLAKIDESIHLLLDGPIPYEFRTTVVRELHDSQDFIEIGHWIHGASQYYLQNFVDSEHLICPNQYSSYDRKTLKDFCELLRPHVQLVALRGID